MITTGDRPEFAGPVKPFCPCDAGRPQDCKPEEWGDAHAPMFCSRCGKPRYQHAGLRYCRENAEGARP